MPNDPLHGLGAPNRDSIERGYETRDVRLDWIIGSFVTFAIFSVLMAVGLWMMLRYFQNKALAKDAPNSVLSDTVAPRGGVPLQPQQGHEMTDAQDLAAMHAYENATFAKLGWAWDERTHTYTVPPAVIDAVRSRQPALSATQPAATGGHP